MIKEVCKALPLQATVRDAIGHTWQSAGGDSMVAMLGHGVYSFLEAAQLTGLKRSRVREWFRRRSSDPHGKPIFGGDYAPVDNDVAISFHDLIDVYVAGQLRDHGVSLQTIRKAYSRMATHFDTSHPFCRQELVSDGKIVFLRGLDTAAQEELNEVLTGHNVYPQILLPFFQRIDYDKVELLARRWRIVEGVVVDPTICFGKPIVENAGIPTAILAAAYHANAHDTKLVADWYNVAPGHVVAAVEFEKKLAA